MSTVYLLVGIPGSGKSTWAQQFSGLDTCDIISTDAIRGELTGDPGDQRCSREAFDIAYARLRTALYYGHDVCFDATNVTRQARQRVMRIAHQADPSVVLIAVTFPISVSEAIQRQALRDRQVPADVIAQFAQRYEYPSYAEGFAHIV